MVEANAVDSMQVDEKSTQKLGEPSDRFRHHFALRAKHVHVFVVSAVFVGSHQPGTPNTGSGSYGLVGELGGLQVLHQPRIQRSFVARIDVAVDAVHMTGDGFVRRDEFFKQGVTEQHGGALAAIAHVSRQRA